MCCNTHSNKINAVSYGTLKLCDDAQVQARLDRASESCWRGEVTFALAWSPVKSTERLTPFTVEAPALVR